MHKSFSLLALMALTFGAAAAQYHSLQVSAQTSAIAKAGGAFQKWLDEDALYIITAEERRAFLYLKTDDEREQFIEAFWRRRDPDLATEENEFRVEHYARITHADRHFAADGVPGWATDRGRIYILHGRPDEVRKTPSGEVWIYKPLMGRRSGLMFEFSAVNGKGDLRLRP